MSSNPLKRPSDSPRTSDEPPPKKPKAVYSIFDTSPRSPPLFKWLPKIDQSCWTGTNGQFECHPKLAMFDVDGTLLKGPSGGHPIAPDKWEWWNPLVPSKLKELHADGYSIVMVSNQGSTRHVKNIQVKVPLVAAKLPDVPFRIFAAPLKDQFRKPRPGTFNALEAIYVAAGVKIGEQFKRLVGHYAANTHPDREASFFVGDAAGRQRAHNSDHSDCDLKYAANISLPFYTPEQYFLGLPGPNNIVLKGFHPTKTPLPASPLFTPTSSPLLPNQPIQEIIVFVGYPALGKSSFFRKYLDPAGYSHVNQDTLKTVQKCIKACTAELEAGKSVAIDNTNRDAATRARYLKLAKDLKVTARCFWFCGPLELARHNNLYRAFGRQLNPGTTKRDVVPDIAFATYTKAFEEPKLEEGFQEIKQIHFNFEGTDEEKAAYNMWFG